MRFLHFLVFSFLCIALSGQDDCECVEETAIKVCYLSIDGYCDGASFNCEYSMDGDFMRNYMARKLTNLDNFGPSGPVDCTMDLIPMQDFTSVQAIENNECDIFFTGNFFLDTLDNSTDINKTSVPTPTLQAIKDWSIQCNSNIVIVTQAEANLWGYVSDDLNDNPNTPVLGSSVNAIFDGPFGTVPEFNQGGSYQGVFSQTPATGFTPLAEDDRGQITAALDNLTNDLIFGDIGIFCGDNAGMVSNGGGLQNNNDILICNIFALGCQIAEGTSSTFPLEEICPGQTVLLPDGEVVDMPGIYIDSLKASNGCDSIVYTEVVFRQTPIGLEAYIGCMGDGYEIEINGNLYNEFNTQGVESLIDAEGCDTLVEINFQFNQHSSFEILESPCMDSGFEVFINGNTYDQENTSGIEVISNAVGCDSTVNIDLQFIELRYDSIQQIECSGGGYEVMVGSVRYDEINPVGSEILVSSLGCDSIVEVDLTFIFRDTFEAEFSICENDMFNFDGNLYGPGSYQGLVVQDEFGCDSLYDVNIIGLPQIDLVIDTFISIDISEEFTFSNEIPSNQEINWIPTEGLSCTNCPNPEVEFGSYIPQYTIEVQDPNGCLQRVDITMEYTCDILVPNVVSLSSNYPNNVLEVIVPCPFDNYEIGIFDRWGSEVFSSQDPLQVWDGRLSNSKLQQGVYVYIIDVEQNGIPKQYIGSVTLMN